MSRPCQYCIADWAPSEIGNEECEWRHRDDPRVYALARALAVVFQQRNPTDQQIAWFLSNADQVVDDFDPPPAVWRARRLRPCVNDQYDGIEVRLRINGVTYVGLEGGKDDDGPLMKLAEFRRSQRPAEQPEPARGVGWRLARDEEIQDTAHMAAMEQRMEHEAEQPTTEGTSDADR